eukprot:5758104-Amphidinium_carterae.1
MGTSRRKISNVSETTLERLTGNVWRWLVSPPRHDAHSTVAEIRGQTLGRLVRKTRDAVLHWWHPL